MSTESTPTEHGAGIALSLLTLGALGVVFGDIGTSPLYAMRVAFGPGGLPLDEPAIFGVLSLIFWRRREGKVGS